MEAITVLIDVEATREMASLIRMIKSWLRE
jgi:hypothetical protein